MTTTEVIDPDVLQRWLSQELAQPVRAVQLELLPQGHANGAWRIVADVDDLPVACCAA